MHNRRESQKLVSIVAHLTKLRDDKTEESKKILKDLLTTGSSPGHHFQIADVNAYYVMESRKNYQVFAHEGEVTLLYYFCMIADITFVHLLLQHPDINVNQKAKNSIEDSALHRAVSGGRELLPGFSVKMVEMLLAKGADVNIIDVEQNMPLLNAINMQQPLEVINLLIKNGANVNHKGEKGKTPLFLAVEKKLLPIVTRLVEAGAIIDEYNHINVTALILACHFGAIDIIRYLLEHGADSNRATVEGMAPLIYAAKNQDNPEILELLLNHGAKINHQDHHQRTALMTAVLNEQPENVRFLLKQPGIQQLPDGEGATPLCIAGLKNNLNLVKILVEGRVEIDTLLFWNKSTVLMMMAQKGFEEIVDYLITQGADINKKNTNNITALDFAGDSKHISIAKKLIALQPKELVEDPLEVIIHTILSADLDLLMLVLEKIDFRFQPDLTNATLMFNTVIRRSQIESRKKDIDLFKYLLIFWPPQLIASIFNQPLSENPLSCALNQKPEFIFAYYDYCVTHGVDFLKGLKEEFTEKVKKERVYSLLPLVINAIDGKPLTPVHLLPKKIKKKPEKVTITQGSQNKTVNNSNFTPTYYYESQNIFNAFSYLRHSGCLTNSKEMKNKKPEKNSKKTINHAIEKKSIKWGNNALTNDMDNIHSFVQKGGVLSNNKDVNFYFYCPEGMRQTLLELNHFSAYADFFLLPSFYHKKSWLKPVTNNIEVTITLGDELYRDCPINYAIVNSQNNSCLWCVNIAADQSVDQSKADLIIPVMFLPTGQLKSDQKLILENSHRPGQAFVIELPIKNLPEEQEEAEVEWASYALNNMRIG